MCQIDPALIDLSQVKDCILTSEDQSSTSAKSVPWNRVKQSLSNVHLRDQQLSVSSHAPSLLAKTSLGCIEIWSPVHASTARIINLHLGIGSTSPSECTCVTSTTMPSYVTHLTPRTRPV